MFTPERLNKSPAIFDVTKLTWMNSCYIRNLEVADFHKLAMPYYEKCLTRKVNLEFLSSVLQKRVETLAEICPQIDFIEQMPEYDTTLYQNKKMKTDEQIAKTSLELAVDVLEKTDTWTNENLFETLKSLAENNGLKNGQVLYPIRIALSGKETTPGGATELAVILGKEETVNRIKQAIAKL